MILTHRTKYLDHVCQYSVPTAPLSLPPLVSLLLVFIQAGADQGLPNRRISLVASDWAIFIYGIFFKCTKYQGQFQCEMFLQKTPCSQYLL